MSAKHSEKEVGATLTCRPWLPDQSLQPPIESFAPQLPNQRIKEGELPAIEDYRDIRAEEKDWREGNDGQQLGQPIVRVILDVCEAKSGVPLWIDGR